MNVFQIQRSFAKNDNSKNLSVNQFLLGGVSGSLATITALPLDVLRTRLVSQSVKSYYKSLPDAVFKIYKNDGIPGFFRGTVPAVVQTFPASGLTFAWYNVFKSALKTTPGIEENVASVVAGFCSGLLVKLIVHPLDVFKKRLMIQGFEVRAISSKGDMHLNVCPFRECMIFGK